MKKLLIGGSPCTFWSIAQKNNRETEPEGLGWELFNNYLIAKKKFNPDFFLYENNKSAAQPIKDQISRELGVDLMHINSALVSAQNRQRFYAFNWQVEQPEDRGLLLRDILVTGADGIGIGWRGRQENGKWKKRYESNGEQKANALTTAQTDSMVAEPIRVGGTPRPNGELSTSQAKRVYSIEGKSVKLTANGGGEGAKTGMYAIPVLNKTLEKGLVEIVEKHGFVPEMFNAYNRSIITDKAPTLSTGSMVTSSCAVNRFENILWYAEPVEWDEKGKPTKARSGADGKIYTVYEVVDGIITIKGKQYPIKLPDGFYIIRKLTPVECERLQTLPDGYTRAVSDAQRYKGLGNGWTAEVIIHILNGILKDVPRDEEIVVLSMYDGIGTGRYCLDAMGFTNVKYFAYEIDKYAKQVAMSNYPDIIQCGDAFDLRHPDWTIGY